MEDLSLLRGFATNLKLRELTEEEQIACEKAMDKLFKDTGEKMF